jgi:predicted transcriptional regulator
MLLISEQEEPLQQSTSIRLVHIDFLYREQHLTQAQIAHKLKIHQSTVSRDIKKLGLAKIKHSRTGEVRPARYKKYRYCKHCKWIPIKSSNKNNCPTCNSKLRNSSKAKSKSKKEVKRL